MKYISNDRILNITYNVFNNEPWKRESVKTYASGREAIISLIDAFSINSSNNTVLLPAYVPEGLYAPFIKKKWNVILYPIDKKLNPHWNELDKLLQQHKPAIAILIHYFGLIKPIEKFTELCHKTGTKVIEDHAHILPKIDDSLKYTGDIILYSLPKMLGTPDGAILINRDSQIKNSDLIHSKKKTNTLYLTKQILLLIYKFIIIKIPSNTLVKISSMVAGKLLNPYNNLMSLFHQPNKMSRASKFLIKHTDFKNVIKVRSEYMKMYHEQLDDNLFTKIHSPTEKKYASLGYPVLIQERESFIKFLSTKAIYGTMLINKWDYTVIAHPSKYIEDTRHVINHHFIFPTAFHLSKQQIQYIIDCANQWSREKG